MVTSRVGPTIMLPIGIDGIVVYSYNTYTYSTHYNTTHNNRWTGIDS